MEERGDLIIPRPLATYHRSPWNAYRMFSGLYEHNLDRKGRVIVPARFREALGEAVYVTNGLDGCLWLFEISVAHAISERMKNQPTGKSEVRDLKRFWFSGSEVPVDGQGRVLLPGPLRSYAGLDPSGSITIVGVGDRLELWSTARWAGRSEERGEAAAAAAENLPHVFP